MSEGRTEAGLLAEFDGSVCPACHHHQHDPGSCPACPRCELHTDEAMAFVLRYEPDLVAEAAALDVDVLAEALFDAVRRVIVEGYDSDGTYDALHTAFYAYRDRAILAGEKA